MMKLKKYVFGCEVKLFFIKEKYSNLFLYIKVVFLKIVWVHGLMNGCVCVWGGEGFYEQENRGIDYQVCNTTQGCF